LSENGLLGPKKIEIKYGCEVFDIRNIFLIETSPDSEWNLN
jgi:hypothetical protein